MEIEMAVEKQVELLREVIYRYQASDIKGECNLSPSISSAPFNDSYFDSLTLYVHIGKDGSAILGGTITEWDSSNGNTFYIHDIKKFPSFDDLVEWYIHSGDVSEFCTKAMLGPSTRVEGSK